MITTLHSPLIPHHTESRILMKAECLQPFGSYKIRGVEHFFKKRLKDLRRRNLVVASAGNMAQAVAYFSRLYSVSCTIFVPDSAPETKKRALLKLGAHIIERPFDEIWKMVREGYSGSEIFLHPACSTELTQGYESIVQELFGSTAHKISAIVVPFGVGGLISGVSRAVKQLSPGTRVYASEIATAAPLFQSLKLGAPSCTSRMPSFVDAIGTPEVLPEVFEEISGRVDGSLVVSLSETSGVIKDLFTNHSLVVEGAAATALAAAHTLIDKGIKGQVIAILTGGNIDLDLSFPGP